MLPNSNIHGIERLQRIAKLAEIFFGFGKVGPQVVHGGLRLEAVALDRSNKPNDRDRGS